MHKHKWQYYLEESPTCAKVGSLMMICLKCGEMAHQEISKEPHRFYRYICMDCGASAHSEVSLNYIELPLGMSHDNAWTTSEIYQTACTLGCELEYDQFLKNLSRSDIAIRQPSFNIFGNFTVTTSIVNKNETVIDVPISLPLDKINLTNTEDSIGTILRVDITDGNIVATYSDGMRLNIGTFNASHYTNVEGFGINEENELIIYYANDTIAFVGSLAN